MKATEMLKKQHREVESLLRKALKSEGPKEKEQLAHEIVDKLTMHASLEEKIFYPAYRENTDAQKDEDRVLEAYEEHGVVKLLLGEITKADPEAEAFDAKLTVLKELIEHHVEEEEGEMFPSAEKKLGKDRLEELGIQMQEAAGLEPQKSARQRG